MYVEMNNEDTDLLVQSTTLPTSSRCFCGKSRKGRIICPPGQDCTAAIGKHWVLHSEDKTLVKSYFNIPLIRVNSMASGFDHQRFNQ